MKYGTDVQHHTGNKKAVLSQRWPRDTPYIWMHWKFLRLPDYAQSRTATFPLSVRVSEILPLLCSSKPPLVSAKFSHVPLGIGGWPLGYEDQDVVLIVRAISFQDFQPMCDHNTVHQRHRRTDKQTDDMRSQDSALHPIFVVRERPVGRLPWNFALWSEVSVVFIHLSQISPTIPPLLKILRAKNYSKFDVFSSPSHFVVHT